MNLYDNKSSAVPQKLTLTLIELAILALSGWILFGEGAPLMRNLFGLPDVTGTPARYVVIFMFSMIVFLRMSFMMVYLMRRHMPWSEVFIVPLAFGLYYIGFALLVLPSDAPLGLGDVFAISLFGFGCFLNTGSELQRHFFKLRSENKGKLFTGGLFRYSMHINFFGDIVWIAAYALVTQNIWSVLIVMAALALFARINVPQLDAYLAERYGDQFAAYRAQTKRLIPFIW